MKKILLTLLILPVFVSAEPWVDYELSEEVIEMTVVTVKPGMKDDYLMGIKKNLGRCMQDPKRTWSYYRMRCLYC